MNSQRIVATFPKTRRKAVRVTIGERDKQTCIDIRQFEPNGKRELMPTPQGVVIPLTMIPGLIVALKSIARVRSAQ